ncbi:hypothetical protein [Spiribacter vilamensis]|uniref:Terminase n=1 Tax=Spiribacter vilamensis TaxID=531306 RepID=A0A4Q8D0E2_9GAMM|nr:hypothetical protein [Spiribacter vilamensis]RZU98779.1 hypothetical protein EV698_1041 [Spiribacter vilamensis]TVO62200.1 hypothetical protein FPL09_09005 [Spiribacter vilamensis]
MTVDIRQVMTDPALFGGQFGGDSWAAWRALLAGFYGLPLDDAEAEHWFALTGRTAPTQPHAELWQVVGRRGGKSQCAALLAVYEAAFRDHRDKLAPGEVATVRCMAADRAQARSVMRYVVGLLESNPMLAAMIDRQDKESVELTNRSVIEVGTASYRTARGFSYAAIICDEIAFYRSEDSANPDFEIINAVRPGLATLGGPLLALSSPYARRGELWDNYRQHYAQDGDEVLVAQASSRYLNPNLPQRIIDKAYERDASSAAAEYGAQFRSDIESFIQREVLDAATRSGPLEIPYMRGRTYQAFIDPAGGGGDEFSVSIGHRDNGVLVVDCIRARKGTPAEIVEEYAALLKSYGVRKATSDRYAGSWPSDEFNRHGIKVEPSAKPKSDLYRDCLAALNSGQVELPPDDRLTLQFQSLERRTSRGGRDSIDHPPNGHDDRANAVAGLVATSTRPVVSVADML